MSADANLSSEDMRVLDRFEQERVANKSSDPVLSRIAGVTSDEQFLEVVGLDTSAVERVTLRAVDVGTELQRQSRRGDLQPAPDGGHSKPHGLDTWMALRHVTQLLGPECSNEH